MKPLTIDDVTCLIVNYNTPDLIRDSYTSFRVFYPNVKMIIVDNGSGDECVDLIKQLAVADKNLRPIFNVANYGHGPGMHIGIESVQTRLVLILDSDTKTFQGGFIEKMAALFSDDVYAVGEVVTVNERGLNDANGNIKYAHPSRSMYDTWKYDTMRPFVHDGAPCIFNMKEALSREFAFVDFPIKEYITRATCSPTHGNAPPCVSIAPLDSNRPFISFVTRHYKRPTQLSRCMEYLSILDDQDYENVIITDTVGVGVAKANGFFFENRHRVHGKYVHLIDDDDFICDSSFVSTMKCIAANERPDIIVIKAQHPHGVLPNKESWKGQLKRGAIGGSSVVVKWDIWQRFIHLFGNSQKLAGDWNFISEIFNPSHGHRVYW